MENQRKRAAKVFLGTGIVIALVLLGMIMFIDSCDAESNYLEIISPPQMSTQINYTVAVTAEVKNKSEKTIKVQLTCTLYSTSGSVTENIRSSFVTLAPGESTKLKAVSKAYNSWTSLSKNCDSFGNVEYKFL